MRAALLLCAALLVSSSAAFRVTPRGLVVSIKGGGAAVAEVASNGTFRFGVRFGNGSSSEVRLRERAMLGWGGVRNDREKRREKV